MIDDLNKKKGRIGSLFDEVGTIPYTLYTTQINQTNQKHQLPPNFPKELEEKFKLLRTQELLLSTKALAIEQRGLLMRLDELVTALGLVDKCVADGQQSLREDNTYFRDLQTAEQVLTSIHQRIQYASQEGRYGGYQQSDPSELQVPLSYQYQIINRLQVEIENIKQAS